MLMYSGATFALSEHFNWIKAHFPSLPCVLSAPCQPCSDVEILLAVCTSDIGKSLLVYPAEESSNKFRTAL